MKVECVLSKAYSVETAPLLRWAQASQTLIVLKQALKTSVLVNQTHGLGSTLCHVEGRFWSIFLEEVQGEPANRRSFHCPTSAEIQNQRQNLPEEPATGRKEVILPSM